MQPTKSPFETQVVWEPILGSSQEFALDSRADHTLYTGSRGPGKTDTQLMRFARNVGIGYGSSWRGVIFDREYKNLDDLVLKSKKWFNRIFKGKCRFLESKGDYKWVWDSGEELLFRVIKKKSDYDNYHGHEYPFIGWNELTKYPTSELYDMMMSCNRTSWTQEKDSPKDAEGNYTLQQLRCEVFSTCNSSGPGHRWVKRRFIEPAPYGILVFETVNIFNPRSQRREDVVRSQVTIFGSYKENIYLDPGYVAELEREPDPNRRKSWLEGSWDIISGGAFDDLWKTSVHIVPRFPIPPKWYIDRSFDWGSSAPFSVGWWAEANGEEVVLPTFDERGKHHVWAPPKGSIIRCHEWYGVNPKKINEGIRMSAGDIAKGIREREIALMKFGWFGSQPFSGPADNQIRNVIETDNDTIEKKMQDEGIAWEKSDKSAGSRKNGFQLFRDRLLNSTRGEKPGFFVMAHCKDWLSTVPVLPTSPDDPDDIDTDAEDHPWDETRYRVLKGNNRIAQSIKVTIGY